MRNNNETPDKLTDIKKLVYDDLLVVGIINKNGDILDLHRYASTIQGMIKSREAEEEKLSKDGSIPADSRNVVAVLIGEIEYLKQILAYRKNIKQTYPELSQMQQSYQSPLQRIHSFVRTMFVRNKCRE